MKYVTMFVLLISPLVAVADYDSQRIKEMITEQGEVFGLEGWKLAENGKAHIAVLAGEGMILSVGKDSAGMLAAIQSSSEAAGAMLRCMQIGNIGVDATSEAERGKVADVVQLAATSSSAQAVNINKVRFEVTPRELGRAVYLSCMLSPAG